MVKLHREIFLFAVGRNAIGADDHPLHGAGFHQM
jgi:hypothetical protein